MKEKVSVFMNMYITSEGVRQRFKDYLGGLVNPLKPSDVVDVERFKSELKDFCVQNPTCISKVRV